MTLLNFSRVTPLRQGQALLVEGYARGMIDQETGKRQPLPPQRYTWTLEREAAASTPSTPS